MNYDWLFRVFLSIGVRAIPALIGWTYWKCYNRQEKAFIILLGYDVFGIIIGALLAYYYHNNIIMTNIYIVLEVSLLSIFYQQFLHNNIAKTLLFWFPFCYAIMVIVSSVFAYGIHNNNPIGNAIGGLFSVVFGVIALAHISNNDQNLIKQGLFWIASGLFGYYLMNMGYLSMRYWFLLTDSVFNVDLTLVLNLSFYFVNVLFALGLWLIAKERIPQLQKSK